MIQNVLSACLLAALLIPASAAELSKSELEGRQLAQQLLDQSPAESSSLTAVLKIRDSKGKRSEVPVRCQIILTETNWQTIYETVPGTNSVAVEKMIVTHNGTNASQYELNGAAVPAAQTAVAFAGSDFWVADLGLEFFHWPAQRVVKKEFRSNCSCIVLESTNPEPTQDGYARVVSWIDKETDGIVHAEAYGANGKQLKIFDPKTLKKINGKWELQEMEIRNVQAGSRTKLEFNLEPKL
jgi:Outer membrane lipoprotein-sorting protein